MSDWQVGDLALCVDAADQAPGGTLCEGAIYSVHAVLVGQFTSHRGRRHMAALDVGQILPCDPDRFRKIRPDAHEACEEEFVTLLRRKKVRA